MWHCLHPDPKIKDVPKNRARIEELQNEALYYQNKGPMTAKEAQAYKNEYKWSPKLKLYAGAAYVKVKKATIDNSGTPPSGAQAYGRLNGSYSSNTVIVSAQVGYTV